MFEGFVFFNCLTNIVVHLFPDFRIGDLSKTVDFAGDKINGQLGSQEYQHAMFDGKAKWSPTDRITKTIYSAQD